MTLKGNVQMEGYGYHQSKRLGGNADKIGLAAAKGRGNMDVGN